LALLKRVRSGEALSSAELAELEAEERQQRMESERIVFVADKKPKKGKRRRRLISPLRLKRLAFLSESLTEADAKVKLTRPLRDVIEADQELTTAWNYGRFLRNLEEAAKNCQSVSRAARWLKLDGGGPELRQILDNDAEANDIWLQSWMRTEMAVKTALLNLARAGNHQAVKTVGLWLRDAETPQAGQAVSFRRIPQKQLAELFNVTRQSIDRWWRQAGLPRNDDNSYNLFEVLPWFESYVSDKAKGGKADKADDWRRAKTRRIQIDADRELGKLVDREAVINGFIKRFELYKKDLQSGPRDVAPLVENQSLSRIREVLTHWIAGILAKQKELPEALDIPPAAADHLRKCVEALS
jgi:hypothetical protein